MNEHRTSERRKRRQRRKLESGDSRGFVSEWAIPIVIGLTIAAAISALFVWIGSVVNA